MGTRLIRTGNTFGSTSVPAVEYENGDTENWWDDSPISLGLGNANPTHTFADRQEWRAPCYSFSSNATAWRLSNVDGIVMDFTCPLRSRFYTCLNRGTGCGPAVVFNPQYRLDYVNHGKLQQSVQFSASSAAENVSVIPLTQATKRAIIQPTPLTTAAPSSKYSGRTKAIVLTTAALLTVGGVVAYACSRKRSSPTARAVAP
jgi:hypothetical protein